MNATGHGYSKPMTDETTSEDDRDEGEPGREEVAGDRDGQPGYDLDEGAAYEQAGAGEDDDAA